MGERRPNILWYCTDQQRFDTIARLGYSHHHTPRLDAFMDDAVTFTHAYCQAPICTPSRAGFLTGMYPSAVGVNKNGNPAFPAHYAERLVPRRLRDAGYDCGLVGKLHLATAKDGLEPRVDDGYRVFDYSHSTRGPNNFGHHYAEWIRSQGVDPADLMGEPVQQDVYRDTSNRHEFGGLHVPTAGADNIPADLHQTRWATERSLDFVDRNRGDKPWMLSVNIFDPHPPFDPPYEYYRRFDVDAMPLPHVDAADLARQRRLHQAGIDFQNEPTEFEPEHARQMQACYAAMVELIDTEFGRLIDGLAERGELDNTLVIFVSDHGETCGDHGLSLKGCRFYEGSVRVPLMIIGPGVEGGRVTDDLVELTDLAPTIYDTAGVETPWWVQGRSLTDALAGRAHGRAAVRCEYFGAIDFPSQSEATMYRDRNHKLVAYHDAGIFELFDLEDDPWELVDRSEDPDYRDVFDRLLKASFAATAGARPPVPERVAPY